MDGQLVYNVIDRTETPWQILGVDASCSPDVIKAAFRQKIVECHPDKGLSQIHSAEYITLYKTARDMILSGMVHREPEKCRLLRPDVYSTLSPEEIEEELTYENLVNHFSQRFRSNPMDDIIFGFDEDGVDYDTDDSHTQTTARSFSGHSVAYGDIDDIFEMDSVSFEEDLTQPQEGRNQRKVSNLDEVEDGRRSSNGSMINAITSSFGRVANVIDLTLVKSAAIMVAVVMLATGARWAAYHMSFVESYLKLSMVISFAIVAIYGIVCLVLEKISAPFGDKGLINPLFVGGALALAFIDLALFACVLTPVIALIIARRREKPTAEL